MKNWILTKIYLFLRKLAMLQAGKFVTILNIFQASKTR